MWIDCLTCDLDEYFYNTLIIKVWHSDDSSTLASGIQICSLMFVVKFVRTYSIFEQRPVFNDMLFHTTIYFTVDLP